MDVLSTHPIEIKNHHFSPDCARKLYHKSGIQVDLWNDEYANQIVQRSIDAQLAGRVIRIIHPVDLIAMKLRAQRLKDDCDISQIILNTPLDEAQLALSVTPEQLAHFALIKKRS